MKFSDLSVEALNEQNESLSKQYQQYAEARLNLDLTRGKPAPEQLDLANDLDGILNGLYILQDGTDVRNYGGLLGIPEARALGGEILGIPADHILVGGNSSLTLMYMYVASMMQECWLQEANESNSEVKFLCPVPGYDRHFTICEHFNIEMINIEMTSTGPDMDHIESLIKQDPMIKGIWCVPKYSNPTGVTYNDETVQRMARLPRLAGEEFRIMWDNAYAVHHLSDDPDRLLSLADLSLQEDTTDNVIMVASTSKITFAGSGISFIGMSDSGLSRLEKFLSASTIGSDKVNQLRHARFLQNPNDIQEHMKKHRAIIQPKFELVERTLTEHLAGKDIASWTHPSGGYFVSLDTQPGLATTVIELAGEIGVKLTPAGATFPYGKDPEDSNIRIAPTYPSLDSLKQALEVFVVCLQLATVQQLINQNV
ncbi:MAG TPA: aminotransferase class I/II-fold pyridoxal phosphate-dependent enzyme [Pseudomonadales bacterium]|jgi:aspartate/methionine/tyrosine aminotransferase|nr:aminotransferase [Gammaproteobacteria bacterium]MDP6026900.1 aminotransferase class I/II-fold pyridoxal phosphate-dependent enzyme [Pseudomonadales bacterium]MDP6316403.1 aminotransferase class I/II-fold pyridoxal phosphate-dependent enzyme [Pseudomonadales bacterium]MDP7314993.1 aminotransferase class I/II-fold pyridoxal phosphate-dependent enzyme [Pseudomonadales bacterium]HJL60954.1 aminotransferase class I/II-fold pyridoxal phosphate-dependent enzyme [Pseudomonadales bacterium]|tara:strand:- start:27535 stop:28812 length:1278 start_codon:yes stop_codon:yes gene_type:complete